MHQLQIIPLPKMEGRILDPMIFPPPPPPLPNMPIMTRISDWEVAEFLEIVLDLVFYVAIFALILWLISFSFDTPIMGFGGGGYYSSPFGFHHHHLFGHHSHFSSGGHFHSHSGHSGHSGHSHGRSLVKRDVRFHTWIDEPETLHLLTKILSLQPNQFQER